MEKPEDEPNDPAFIFIVTWMHTHSHFEENPGFFSPIQNACH